MKNFLIFALKLAISFFLLSFIISKIGIHTLKHTLQEFSWSYLVLAGVWLSASVTLSARRWGVILEIQKSPLDFRWLQKCTYMGFFFNQGLPSSIGGDVFRVFWLKHRLGAYGNAIASVLLDRLYGMVGLLLLSLFALLFQLSSTHHSLVYLLIPSTLVLMGAIFGVIMIQRFGSQMKIWFGKIQLLHDLIDAITEFKASLFDHMILIFWTALSHLTAIAAYMVLASALNISMTWGQALLIIPLTFIIGTLPISLAGWGIREGTLIYALGFYGVEPEKALALSVLFGLAQWLPGFVGLVLWLPLRQTTNSLTKTQTH